MKSVRLLGKLCVLAVAFWGGCFEPPIQPVPGCVHDYSLDSPLPEALVCLSADGNTWCGTSLQNGCYYLENVSVAEANTRSVLTITKYDHVPSLRQHYLHPVLPCSLGTTNVIRRDVMLQLLGHNKEKEDPTRGHLLFDAYAKSSSSGKWNPTSGVKVTLEPTPQSNPLYLDSIGGTDEALTSTGDLGRGWWLNLQPGEYKVTATAPGMQCIIWPGWHETRPSSGNKPQKSAPTYQRLQGSPDRVVVKKGHVTQMEVQCQIPAS